MSDINAALSSYFGYRSFRPHQEAVVRSVLAGRDSFTVMPTGGGKSLCYQLPAVLLPGVCVVVSPLISLMKDQVDAARASGIRAAAFNSASSMGEKNAVRAGLRNGSLELLYVSPERLRVREFLEYLKGWRIAFFAIDEAHCISAWGHDFRPDYLALSELVHEFPGVPLAAFTATATFRVEEDIIRRLGLRDPLLTRASFDRPNLFYQVTPKEDPERQILEFLRERRSEPGIIYRTTRKDVERTAAFLQKKGTAALAYHAGLPDTERAAVQDAFRRDECTVIVATIAFGMGIDKSNVRFVVHADLPRNLESYYQETGRAGRDGEAARCALFYGRQDIARLMAFAEGMEDPEARETSRQQLFRMLDFTRTEGCRRRALLAYFGEELPGDNCGGCDICAGEVEREDASVGAQKLLSAMVRTGCRFGARHVIDIVLGKDSKRIRAFSHQELPTFGVGRDRDERYWRRVMDALLVQGLAVVADARFPTPAVTEKGWEVLRGKKSCAIVRVAEKAKEKRRAGQEAASPLFSHLREERMRLSREFDVPPYVIFSDKSLREMAEQMPCTPDEFLRINGVGQHKLHAYGGRFLDLIAVWLREHPEDSAVRERNRAPAGSSEDPAGPVPGPATCLKPDAEQDPERDGVAEERSAASGRIRGDSARETERLLDGGMSLEEAAEARGVAVATILRHMEMLSATGKHYPPERFMEPDRLEWFRLLFAAAGSWRLGPVVELAGGEAAPAPHASPAPEDVLEEPGASDAPAVEAPATPAAGGTNFAEARLARLLLNVNGGPMQTS